MSNWDFAYGREPADPREPYDQQAASYPLTYERDDDDGGPPWLTGPRRPSPPQAGPRRPADPWQTGQQSAALTRNRGRTIRSGRIHRTHLRCLSCVQFGTS